MSYFPFDEYIGSEYELEYKKDLNMRNSIVKYLNAILIEPTACEIPLRKFLNVALFFKNTFCKESFLYFYMNRFDEEDRKITNLLIFDIFIKEQDGVIGEHKKFYKLSYELFRELDLNSPVKGSWDYINSIKH